MELSVVARCPHQNHCQKCFHFLVSANSKKSFLTWRKRNVGAFENLFFILPTKTGLVVSVKVFVTCSGSPWVLAAKWLLGELQNPCVWGNAPARSNKLESNSFESQFHQRILFRKISIEGYLHDLIVREILSSCMKYDHLVCVLVRRTSYLPLKTQLIPQTGAGLGPSLKLPTNIQSKMICFNSYVVNASWNILNQVYASEEKLRVLSFAILRCAKLLTWKTIWWDLYWLDFIFRS